MSSNRRVSAKVSRIFRIYMTRTNGCLDMSKLSRSIRILHHPHNPKRSRDIIIGPMQNLSFDQETLSPHSILC
ncbi:unnamed protein product [Cuscuta campestris]|uniref:Uncharacterized protein n=1 Tax=Cuscuta campestris TaxID=132261 RepID=A0A484MAI2_9ASTE|nr:unnamed protein product [Cuscuta campestris]